MTATKKQSLEDQIIYQMADCTIAEIEKQLAFLATNAYQSDKIVKYAQALREYLNHRIQAMG